MNKITLAAQPVALFCKIIPHRISCLIRGQKYAPNPGPQWQQLELPFSRTPVRRWNR